MYSIKATIVGWKSRRLKHFICKSPIISLAKISCLNGLFFHSRDKMEICINDRMGASYYSTPSKNKVRILLAAMMGSSI